MNIQPTHATPRWRVLRSPATVLSQAKRIVNWSLTSLQQRLAKTGGRLIKVPDTAGCCWWGAI